MTVGCDVNGVPEPETLRKLGLSGVEAKLREVNIIE